MFEKLTDAAFAVVADIVWATYFTAPQPALPHLIGLAHKVEAECQRRGWMPGP